MHRTNFKVHCFLIQLFLCTSFVITSLRCQALVIETPIEDGRMLKGRLEKSEQAFLNDTPIVANADGVFYMAVRQSAPSPIKILVQKNGATENLTFSFRERKWPEEIINGLPPKKVNISTQNNRRIGEESVLLKKHRQETITDIFPMCFSRPVQTYRLSGRFGARRVLNGVRASGHGGADYAAPVGTPITAPADGIVTVAHPDMFLTGQTVLINHGYGLFSSYAHLSETAVKEGNAVKRGDLIGKIGKTGRATGPHLHFSFFWYETRVDPERLFDDFPCE